jgi:hypothetical protein
MALVNKWHRRREHSGQMCANVRQSRYRELRVDYASISSYSAELGVGQLQRL